MYYYLKARSDSTQRLRIYLAYAQHIHVGVISTTSEVLEVRAFLPPRNFSLPPPSWYPVDSSVSNRFPWSVHDPSQCTLIHTKNHQNLNFLKKHNFAKWRYIKLKFKVCVGSHSSHVPYARDLCEAYKLPTLHPKKNQASINQQRIRIATQWYSCPWLKHVYRQLALP